MKLGISTKIVTRPEQRKSDGTNVIYLRITKNRKVRYLSTGLTATSADLSKDRKKIKNYQLMDQAEALHRRARQILLDYSAEFIEMDASAIVERLGTLLFRGEKFHLDFRAFANKCIDGSASLSAKHNYEVATRAFYNFIGADTMNVADITNRLLINFAEWLQEKGLHHNTITNYTTRIATIYRRAQKEYNDDYTINLPRNITYTMQPIRRESVRALTIDEINKLIAYRPTTPRFEMCKDMFILSLMLCGINFKDICTAKAPVNGVLIYRRQKIARTAGKAAEMQIKIPKKLQFIIDKWADPRGIYFTKLGKIKGVPDDKKITNELTNMGMSIRRIARRLDLPNLTFYSARHSFATIARNVLKVDKSTIDECLTHIGDHRMTDVYIERDYSAVNSVCSGVANIFDLSKYNGGLEVT